MKIEEKLTSLGLSSKEAAVYLATLELGRSTVSKIARQAKINRTTAYDIIINLARQGLVASSPDAKSSKQLYAAESPAKLVIWLEKKDRELQAQIEESKELINELDFIAQKQPGKPRLKLFEGKEGVKELYENSLTAREEIRSFNSVESLDLFDKQYTREYFRRRAKKNIFIKAIINDGELVRELKKRDWAEKRQTRIVPRDKMNVSPEVYFYDNKVSIFSLQENFGVMIESADIATAFKKLYDLAWEEAGKYEE